MRSILLSILFFLLSGFNRFDFNCLLLCTPVCELLEKYGQPYAIHDRGCGIVDYEYVERVSMNNELIYENHYFLRIEEEKLVKKFFREENQPAYDLLYQEDPNYPTYP